MQPYDAVLVVSFGGPEGKDDVLPFLENVLRGRNVPRERMLQVAKHYETFGGVSPINGQNRQLIGNLKEELALHGPNLPVYWGNRNWHPLLSDTVAQMASEGVKRALAFVTSAYSSYSSCRQYIEDIVRARTLAGDHAPAIDKLRVFYNHPLFIQANVANINAAFEQLPELQRSRAVLIFTAHSIPQSMADDCEYEAQLREAGGLIASELGKDRWALAYQSRSGPLSQSWLEPDINDYLQQLSSTGTTDVVVAPIGFVSDHMEIIYDLDTQARSQCEKLGLKMVRASTVGTHPLFINMIRELILERIDSSVARRSSGNRGPGRDFCATECCLRA